MKSHIQGRGRRERAEKGEDGEGGRRERMEGRGEGFLNIHRGKEKPDV